MLQQIEFGAVDFSNLYSCLVVNQMKRKKKYLNFSKPLVFSAFLYVVYFFIPTNSAQAGAFL